MLEVDCGQAGQLSQLRSLKRRNLIAIDPQILQLGQMTNIFDPADRIVAEIKHLQTRSKQLESFDDLDSIL